VNKPVDPENAPGPTESLDWLSPYFLGSYAENDELLEKVLVEFLRDHVYWRRNFHPEDTPPISVLAQHGPDYREFVARMKSELHGLSARLKQSVPFFNPRYIGHMASDLLLPGLIGQMITTLYNPNNVTDEAANVTLEMELEVGRQLAAMFGFSTDPASRPCAWGHVTSGGTLANYEALWYFRAARFWPLTARQATVEAELDPGVLDGLDGAFVKADPARLFNLSLDQVIRLRRQLYEWMGTSLSPAQARALARAIEAGRIESLGEAGFHNAHPELGQPVVMVPVTAHYSWEKALKLLGLGSANLVTVGVTERMRMDPDALHAALARAHDQGRPVLAVIGVLGTTEYGSIDPIHEIVSARQRWRKKGLDFAIHVDAAWGGYLSSLFRAADGSLVGHGELKKKFKYFPGESVYKAFAAVRHSDSVTVDPHKLGYVPFGCGAYVARNRGLTDFISQKAAYVFEGSEESGPVNYERRFRNLGQYILEGSKPGAAATAAWITHRVLPLNQDHFGRLCAGTVHNCEYFFEHLDELRTRLKGTARVILPFEPDSNLVCLAINPEGNRSLAAMNAFGRRIYERISATSAGDIRTREFFGSRTLVDRSALNPETAARLCDELGLDPASFTENVADPETQSDRIFLLRHTLMNPWLTGKDRGLNYLDRYCRHLETLIGQAIGNGQ